MRYVTAGAPAVTSVMTARVPEYWRSVHPDLGARVARASAAAESGTAHDRGRLPGESSGQPVMIMKSPGRRSRS
jgi:hypothetical protein